MFLGESGIVQEIRGRKLLGGGFITESQKTQTALPAVSSKETRFSLLNFSLQSRVADGVYCLFREPRETIGLEY